MLWLPKLFSKTKAIFEPKEKIELPGLIFDFDGVLADTFEAYAEFLAKVTRRSIEHSRKVLIENGLNNKKPSLFYRFGQGIYYNQFHSFLKKQGDLLFEDRIAEIAQLPNPKAILSRSRSKICRELLGVHAHQFTYILGHDNAHTKLKGLEFLNEDPHFNNHNCLFFTDSVGDIKELKKGLNIEQIYAVSWGFHSRKMLEPELISGHVLDSFDELSELRVSQVDKN